jgi:hypothetical protein
MAPDLSLIVTAHQQASFLRDALTSLTRQFDDPSRLEVIVVDDGSDDDPAAVVKEFAGRLPRLEFLSLSPARGVSAARNAGLAVATGRAVAMLDGDDWYAPGHLAHMLAWLDRLGVDFVKCDVIPDTRGTRVIKPAPQARRHVSLEPSGSILPVAAATMIDYPFVWAAVYRRELLDSGLLHFDETLRTAEDREITWRLHLQAASFAVVDAPGILYRRGVATSLTAIPDERQLDFGPAYRKILAGVLAHPEAERFLPKALRQCLAIAHHHVARQHELSQATRAGLAPALLEAVADLSPAQIAEALEGLDPKRCKALRPLLAPALRAEGAEAAA